MKAIRLMKYSLVGIALYLFSLASTVFGAEKTVELSEKEVPQRIVGQWY
jgi:hypothetical protein